MSEEAPTPQKLVVHIGSFSYRKGIPAEPEPHGGGFVFDCRSVPNPGREPEYKPLTGQDAPVIQFLERQPEAAEFYSSVLALTSQAVTRYRARGFESLTIRFGCTGGQHRSVYFAERLARELATKFPLEIRLTHRDKPESGMQK